MENDFIHNGGSDTKKYRFFPKFTKLSFTGNAVDDFFRVERVPFLKEASVFLLFLLFLLLFLFFVLFRFVDIPQE